MNWDNDYNRRPGPWTSGRGGVDPGLEHEIEEHAAHYAALHPDGPARMSLARRIAARLCGKRGGGREAAAQARPPGDVWAREEALYREKNEGKRP